MNKTELLAAKKAELAALAPDIEKDAEGALEKGTALKTEIETLETEIAKDREKAAVLKSIGTVDPIKQEEKKMNALDTFVKKASEVDRSVKGWSVSGTIKMNRKAATDVVTGVQIADIDREMPVRDAQKRARDLFTVTRISGNAVTYFRQGAYEGKPAVTAENAKKPQNSTSFESITLPLSKVAAYIKETDEIVTDAPFLADEVENSLIFEVMNVEDSEIISTVARTTGILAGTYGAGSGSIAATLEDGVLYAIKQIKTVGHLNADSVIINPLDMYALQTAKDANKQYIGGGFFYGAYGNGEYKAPVFLWGVPVFESAEVAQGSVLVTAKQAVKIWTKGNDVDVKLYEQNEDDAIYNRVTLVGEERLAVAVKNLNGVYLLSAE
jgi:HK97 family phage major capsid protein